MSVAEAERSSMIFFFFFSGGGDAKAGEANFAGAAAFDFGVGVAGDVAFNFGVVGDAGGAASMAAYTVACRLHSNTEMFRFVEFQITISRITVKGGSRDLRTRG